MVPQASPPVGKNLKCLLDLPPEVRLNIYKFLEQPSDLNLSMDGSQRRSKRVRCISSRQFPLLCTCSLIRKEFMAFLLFVTRLTLRNGVRPRARHDSRQISFPIWQLCNIRHVSLDLSRKMQFDFFARLKTLTLLWPGRPLEVQATATWRTDSGAFLWSPDGAVAMIEVGRLAVRTSEQPWIKKLAVRKKKRFRLQMQATFGGRDYRGSKSNSLVVSSGAPLKV